MKHSVLMCRPDYFDVTYEINPWMHTEDRPDKQLAMQQWEELYNTYQDLGVFVNLVDPKEGQPDMVFTANAGLVFGKYFIPSQFTYPERQGEEPAFIKWFADHGYEVLQLPSHLHFEGEADRIMRNGELLMASGFRSDQKVAEAVRDLLGVTVDEITLVNPEFYHLDTCLAYYDHDDTILYYPDAFDEASKKFITSRFPNVIEAPKDEAYRYICNSINFDNVIILNKNCPTVAGQLRKQGYKVIELDTSEFMKAGGSIKCMTLKLS